MTNNFTAEFGRGYGAVVLVQTKQGTNRLSGETYIYHNDSDLNAKFYQGCECHNLEIIEAGMRSGVFRQVNLGDACSMMRALIDGLMMQWFFASEMTFDDCHRRCLRVVLEYLTGNPAENVELNVIHNSA